MNPIQFQFNALTRAILVFAGNDGLKGDLRLLQGMPADAIAAGASIVGTGATPEGIDQNPAYYEYTFDTAWHTTAQPLGEWFAELSSRRYGNTANKDAATAWSILSTAVYNSQAGGWHDDTGVEWSGLGNPPTATGIDAAAVLQAWDLLVQVWLAAQKAHSLSLPVGRQMD